MPLHYVTGLSGTGKSTVLRELQRRGLEAYGIDEDGYANWVDRTTGSVTRFPHDDPPEMADWFKRMRWVIDAQRIAQLRERADADRRDVFLCGTGEGEDAAWPHFSTVTALVTDADTIVRRLAGRIDNAYGKHPDEVRDILGWHRGYEDAYRRFGATIVDATKPAKAVVDEILAEVISAKD